MFQAKAPCRGRKNNVVFWDSSLSEHPCTWLKSACLRRCFSFRTRWSENQVFLKVSVSSIIPAEILEGRERRESEKNPIFHRPRDSPASFGPSPCVQAGLYLVQKAISSGFKEQPEVREKQASPPPSAGNCASPLPCMDYHIQSP